MNFAITLFVLGVLAQVSLNAAAPRPYGAPYPSDTKPVSTDPAVKPDTTSGSSVPDMNCGCGATCPCTGSSDLCGCQSQQPAPAPAPSTSTCGCTVCGCKANNPTKQCGCKKPCSCGITNPILLNVYKFLQGLSPSRPRSQY